VIGHYTVSVEQKTVLCCDSENVRYEGICRVAVGEKVGAILSADGDEIDLFAFVVVSGESKAFAIERHTGKLARESAFVEAVL
jgi:hypothetical protein